MASAGKSPGIARGMTFYIDLDGPVLDVSERYYRVYRAIIERRGRQPLDKSAFWEARRRGATLLDVCDVDSAEHPAIRQEWAEMIERGDFLGHDHLVPGVVRALTDLASRHRLCLVTLRRHATRAEAQTRAFGIRDRFDLFLAAADRTGHGGDIKARLVRESPGFDAASAVVIGDSEADVMAARVLRVPSVAVTNGIRSEVFLCRLRPAMMVPSLAVLPDMLPRLGCVTP